MADILDKKPMNAEMTIFKTEVEPNKLNACIDNILMRLNRLETKFADIQPTDRWISVKVRLPNDGERVIAYTFEGSALEMKFDKRRERWGRVGIDGVNGFGQSFITHWQPLSEPPKDGDTK